MRRLPFRERHENFGFFVWVALFLCVVALCAAPTVKGWYDCNQAGGVYVRVAWNFPTGHECIERGQH
jgi:hypothetical protein